MTNQIKVELSQEKNRAVKRWLIVPSVSQSLSCPVCVKSATVSVVSVPSQNRNGIEILISVSVVVVVVVVDVVIVVVVIVVVVIIIVVVVRLNR